MQLLHLPPQSHKPTLDVRLHILPPSLLIIPHLIHAQGIPMRSFVYNFLNLFWVQFSYATRSLVDTAGIPRNIGPNAANLNANAAIGENGRGIVVGSGGLPPTPSDYKLGAMILHGTGSGQLSHSSMSFIAPYIVGDITYAACSRILTNLSGTSIYINEIGLICEGYTSTSYRFLTGRDLLASTITLPNGQAKQFTYTLATEV